MSPSFVIPGTGATGEIVIDSEDETFVIKEDIEYTFYLLHLEGEEQNEWEIMKEEIKAPKRIKFYREDLEEEDVFEEDIGNLSVFEDFIEGLDIK